MEQTVKKPERPHLIGGLRLLLCGVLLCAVVGGACYLAGRAAGQGSEKAEELSAVVLESRLTGVSELASVSYTYTNMAQFESSNDFYGVKVPFTTKSFILTYDGVIKAGVDLSEARVEVSGTAVTVRLGAAKILSHEIEEDSVEIFDEKTSIFNPFTVEDFSSFQTDQKKAMEQRALDRGLLREARTRAEDSVRLLLEDVLPEGCALSFSAA